jgi:hypothetical protein
MFLSMILGQAEVIEAGISSELKIAQSARDSLELCHELLQMWAGSGSLPSLNDTGPPSTNFDSGTEGYELDFDLDFFFPDVTIF